MPLVDIQVLEGVFSVAEKQSMISKVTDVMVSIEGEAMRGVTWVRVIDVPSGQWGIGGKALT
ncbi:MAG: tautomerase family protein, partial [Thermoanaerobaculia bacterium]